MFQNRRLLIIVGVAVIAAVGVLVGVLLGLNSHTDTDHKSVVNEKFEALNEGMTAPDGIPPNGILVTSASEQNWYDLFPYVSRITFLVMPYGVIGEDATHFISISANGTNDESSAIAGSFKYPVLGVAYGTEREADLAKERAQAVMEEDPELTDAKFFTKGNILYFMMLATYTDDQMDVSSLPSSISEEDLADWDVQPGESYWYIDFGAFMESYKETLEDEKYGEGVDKIFAKAGFTEDTYWVGTSEDLEVWDGRFYNLDISNIHPKDFISYFGLFNKKIDSTDPDSWEYFSEHAVNPDDSLYSIEPAQSILALHTEIATRSGVAGSIDRPMEIDPDAPFDEDAETEGPGDDLRTLEKLDDDSPYAVTFKIDPNAWVGMLKGGTVLQAPRVVFINTITADIKPNGEARITVDPITMEEFAQQVQDTLDDAERFAQEQEEVNAEAGIE